jgi:glucose-6-phosphate dehydrogenase assembly protein OpcA
MIRDATIRDVERELARLRNEQTEPGVSPSLRTSVMTHMAWVPERWADAATRALGGLEERHPSRTILLFPRPDSDRDALDASVDLRCFAVGGAGVCFEVIELELHGPRARAPASVVAPLLVPDLPAFLRWRGDLPFGEPELEGLVGAADRLVVDSREWEDAAAGLERLEPLFERIVVSDIAWARTEPWRYELARRWPAIAECETLSVTGPEADARLLAGWLRARLERDVELELEPADELARLAVDGEPVELSRPDERTPSDLLSEQLDIFSRDEVYEEAVCSYSSVPT